MGFVSFSLNMLVVNLQLIYCAIGYVYCLAGYVSKKSFYLK